jgi:hypothetical protein
MSIVYIMVESATFYTSCQLIFLVVTACKSLAATPVSPLMSLAAIVLFKRMLTARQLLQVIGITFGWIFIRIQSGKSLYEGSVRSQDVEFTVKRITLNGEHEDAHTLHSANSPSSGSH